MANKILQQEIGIVVCYFERKQQKYTDILPKNLISLLM